MAALLALGGLLSGGCVSSRQGGSFIHDPHLAGPKAQALALELRRFGTLFETTVERASDEILQADNGLHRTALFWRIRAIERGSTVTTLEPPVLALLETWSLCMRMRAHLETGNGATMFGQWQPMIVESIALLDKRIAEIADSYLGPTKAEQIRAKLRDYARQYPIRGIFSEGGAPPLALDQERGDALAAVLGIPLLPFKALGGAIGTNAIGELPGAADRFTQAVHGLPEDARVQLELLLATVEDSEALRRALTSLHTLAESSKRYGDLAEHMPGEVRRELEALLREVETRESLVRDLLRETRESAHTVDDTLRQVRGAIEEAGENATKFDTAGKTWTRTADAVSAATREIQILAGKGPYANPPQTAPASEPGTRPASHPFDVTEYERAADAIARGAVELRGLVAELRSLTQEPAPPVIGNVRQQAGQLLDETALRAAALTDHAAWRLAQLIAFAFGLLFVYRWFSARTGRGIRANGPPNVRPAG